jgi:hypothetical protein
MHIDPLHNTPLTTELVTRPPQQEAAAEFFALDLETKMYRENGIPVFVSGGVAVRLNAVVSVPTVAPQACDDGGRVPRVPVAGAERDGGVAGPPRRV